MKIFLAIAFVVTSFGAVAADSFQSAVHATTPTHPSLYSFSDIYRLTVSGAALPQAANESPVRVASVQASPTPELQYSVVRMAEPGRWVLVLAGLAAALWVARRRLGYSL
jgi:hypothetical protein